MLPNGTHADLQLCSDASPGTPAGNAGRHPRIGGAPNNPAIVWRSHTLPASA